VARVVLSGQGGIIPPHLALGGGLVIVRQIAQVQERQHVITEIVRVHRDAQLVGDVPKDFAQALFILCGHVAQ